jgi:hypothetical protein
MSRRRRAALVLGGLAGVLGELTSWRWRAMQVAGP